MHLGNWDACQSSKPLRHKPSQLQTLVQLSKPAFRQPHLFEVQPFLQEQLTISKHDFGTGPRNISKGLSLPETKVHPCPSGEGS